MKKAILLILTLALAVIALLWTAAYRGVVESNTTEPSEVAPVIDGTISQRVSYGEAQVEHCKILFAKTDQKVFCTFNNQTQTLVVRIPSSTVSSRAQVTEILRGAYRAEPITVKVIR